MIDCDGIRGACCRSVAAWLRPESIFVVQRSKKERGPIEGGMVAVVAGRDGVCSMRMLN